MKRVRLFMAGGMLGSLLLAACSTTGEGPAAPAVPGSPEQAWTFESAKAQAQLDVSNPAAGPWAQDTSSKIGSLLMTAVPPCAQQAAGGGKLYVELAVQFGLNGKVRQVLTAKDDVFSRCMRAQFGQLEVGSVPKEGYWYWMSLGDPSGAGQPTQYGALKVIADSCKPFPAGTAQDQGTMELLDASPSPGTKTTRQTIASVRFRYNVPDRSPTKYKLFVGYEGGGGIAAIPEPIDFPFPATCGSAGELTVNIALGTSWSMPNPADTVRISLGLLEGDFPAKFSNVANIKTIEYLKQ
jgi:hypothetical protein